MALTDGEYMTQARARRLQASIPTSYTITKIDDKIYGETNVPGGTNYSGDDTAVDTTTLLQNVLATNPQSVFIKRASTSFLTNLPLAVPSNCVIDSDFAVLAANWNSSYSPTGLGLPANFPPIFYNKDYGAAYGRNTNITIKNLILQGNPGQVGAEPGGAIPIRFKGVDDSRLQNLIIDNETLATGSAHANMAQAAISLDRYNRRITLNNITIKGGWAGIYLAGSHESFPAQALPTVGNGANLDTIINTFTIDLAGNSNPFTPGYGIGTTICNGTIKWNSDYAFDLERMDRVDVSNIDAECAGKTVGSFCMLGQGNNIRDITFSNITVSSILRGFEIAVYTGNTEINNFTIRNAEDAIYVVGNPTGRVQFVNCDLREADQAIVGLPTTVKFLNCQGISNLLTTLHFFDDFFGKALMSDIWHTSGVGTPAVAIQDGVNSGVARLTTSTANNDETNIGFNDKRMFSIGKVIVFEVRAKVAEITNIGARLRLFYDGSNEISFRFDTSLGHGGWHAYCVDGGVSTDEDTGVAADTNFHIFRIEAKTNEAKFYIDHVPKNTLTTNVPADMLQPMLSVVTRTTAARNFDVDYVDVEQNR